MVSDRLTRFLIKAGTGINHKAVRFLVMGNEAADLDSMASAVALAFFLDSTKAESSSVPLIPIPREDFKLRTEAVYVFAKAGIDPAHLIFLDDVNLDRLMANTQGLVLVDHNRLSSRFATHASKVEIILDHHKDENRYANTGQKTIEPVGSCATLVGEEIISKDKSLIQTRIALLLAGTILLDTVNLDPGAGRMTSKDERIAISLLESCPLDREIYFQQIQKEKFNLLGLDTADLLRKDYKEFQFDFARCGIASTLIPLSLWLIRDKALCTKFKTLAEQKNLDLFFSMNGYKDPDFKRELALYTRKERAYPPLVDHLQARGLDLETIDIPHAMPFRKGRIGFFSQGNPAVSRKKLVPILDEYFKG